MVLSIENSRIIRIGLLNRKSKHFAKSVDSAFWTAKTQKTEPKTKFSSSYKEEENESPDLSQSDKSSDSSNESASFEWESLTQNLECGQQAITAPRTKIRIRRKVKWQLETKWKQQL